MLDRSSPVPLHLQLEEILRANLQNGTWVQGQAIPSENELTREFGVSRMTVRGVITKLVQEELFERVPGKGTFVTTNKIVATSLSYAGVREQLERMGYAVTTKLLSIKKSTASAKIAKLFALDEEEKFYIVKRLRYAKGVPLSIHLSYIPYKFAPGLEDTDLENEQLCVILSKSYGFNRTKTIETLESVAAKKDEADLLLVKPNHPLLLLEDMVLAEEQVFEYARVVFRGDKIKIHLEF